LDWSHIQIVSVLPTETSFFKITIHQSDLNELKKNRKERSSSLYLRLFSSKYEHQSWSKTSVQGVSVVINKVLIEIPEVKKKINEKNNGYFFVRPLDVTSIMEIEIHNQSKFVGICIAELVQFQCLDEVN